MLLALAATAYHALAAHGAGCPDLIVGHGVLGRLLARLAASLRGAAAVGLGDAIRARATGADGYTVHRPRRPIRAATIARSTTSAATAGILDTLIARLAPGGEIVLAGFYSEPLSLRVSARLHARGAHPRRRRNGATPISHAVAAI